MTEQRKAWESLEWAKRTPDRIKYHEQRGEYEDAEYFKDLMKKHKRWLKTDQGRRDLGEAQMYERPAMKHLQGEHLESCIYELCEECDKIIEEIKTSKEDGELDFFGISDVCADQWMDMLSKIQTEAEGIHELSQFTDEIFYKYFLDAGFTTYTDLYGDEQEYTGKQHFNTVMASIWDGHYELIGFNPYIEDYIGYPMGTSFAAIRDRAKQRMMKLTKEKIISLYSYCINLTLAYMNLQNQIAAVKMAMHLAKGDRATLLDDIDSVSSLYESLNAEKRTTSYGVYISCDREAEAKFDRACEYLLDECWLA